MHKVNSLWLMISYLYLICCNAAPPSELFSLDEGLTAWALGLGLSPKKSPEDRYLLSLASQYQVEQYQDSYGLMSEYRTS